MLHKWDTLGGCGDGGNKIDIKIMGVVFWQIHVVTEACFTHVNYGALLDVL